MPWNCELPDWPNFRFSESCVAAQEREFLEAAGGSYALIKHITPEKKKEFIVDILCTEAFDSSEIEGELLKRSSLQASIKRHFGLTPQKQSVNPKEEGMGTLMWEVYATYDQNLTHEMLWNWHDLLMKGDSHIDDIGTYRTHEEPMQIVSGRHDQEHVFFEAPPSSKIQTEMDAFIKFFNQPNTHRSILVKASMIHLYFESIHPFEDGNGRIGRALVEKFLSKALGHPTLFALSHILLKSKKAYYNALGSSNRDLDANTWVSFFSDAILKAQKTSLLHLHFLLAKAKMMERLKDLINPRQEKVLLRMFAAGPEGFKGGLSAENYIAITKASRATATRDLKQLVELHALIKEGSLRYTRYYLNFEES